MALKHYKYHDFGRGGGASQGRFFSQKYDFWKMAVSLLVLFVFVCLGGGTRYLESDRLSCFLFGEGGPFRTSQIQTIHNKLLRTRIVHASGTFVQKMSKNIFILSSDIQKTTTNPIIALKIIIYNTKHTNNAKIPFRNLQQSKTIEKRRNKSKNSKTN